MIQPLGLILRNCFLKICTSPIGDDSIYTIKSKETRIPFVKKSEMSGDSMVQKTFDDIGHMFVDSYP